uniref:thrombospondin-type laminin G domain and EAR repeat-containing protein-like n=1 Tax=Monopterus albus TaxID=43700 RepID=UPI0009B4A2E3|nr:thrombospondin-type laminin G domain and EAR repeat-containing protein-like [Monopterus albus]
MPLLIFVQLLLLGLRASDTTTEPWRHCTDLPPLDLLSFVLEKDTSQLVPGVHMRQTGGVRGVHFSSPHTSMSVPSSQLLVNCNLFPKEFSIVVTLKVTPITLKRKEYLFSLMEPKILVKRAVEEKEEENNKGEIFENYKERDISGEEQHGKEKKERGVKSNEKGERIILGLRFSRKHLHFVFKGHGGVVEHWVFGDTQLADNQWHTVVLTIGTQHVKFTVDCAPPLEM